MSDDVTPDPVLLTDVMPPNVEARSLTLASSAEATASASAAATAEAEPFSEAATAASAEAAPTAEAASTAEAAPTAGAAPTAEVAAGSSAVPQADAVVAASSKAASSAAACASRLTIKPGAHGRPLLRQELMLLVLRFLEGDERLAPSFEALRAQAEELGLLGERPSWDGSTRSPATYEQSIRRLGEPPPPEQLQSLLQDLVKVSHDKAKAEGWEPAPGWTFLRGRTPVVRRNERKPMSALRDVCVRGRPAGGHLEAFLSRECGVRLPRRLMPPRALYGTHPATPGTGDARLRRSTEAGSSSGSLTGGSAGSFTGGMRLIASIIGHRSPVYCCCFDRTGRRLVTGADDFNVKIWAMPSGLLQHTLRGHSAEITELKISPDNRYIVSTSNDCTVRVWRMLDGAPEAVLAEHKAAVNSVSFAAYAGSHAMLTVAADASAMLWDTSAWEQPPRVLRAVHAPLAASATGLLNGLPPPPSSACCALSPTGRLGAIGLSTAPYLLLWPTARGGAAARASGASGASGTVGTARASGSTGAAGATGASGASGAAGPIGAAAAARASARLLSSSTNGEANGQTNGEDEEEADAPPVQLHGHSAEVTTACFNHRGDMLLTGSQDGTARVWRWRGRGASYSHVKLLPDEGARKLAHGHALQNHWPAGKPLAMWVDGVAWSADDVFAFTSESLRKQTQHNPCVSSCIRVWTLPHHHPTASRPNVHAKLLHTLQQHPSSAAPVFVLQPHPCDSHVLASAGYDGFVRLWDVYRGIPLAALTTPEGRAAAVEAEAAALLAQPNAPAATDENRYASLDVPH